MKSPVSVAANMSADERKSLGTLALLKTQQVADLADQQGVCRQFVHRQKNRVVQAIDQAFAAKATAVLFHLPVTPQWLDQLMLTLTCKSSCRGVKENNHPPAKPGVFKIVSRSKRLSRVAYATPTLCATSTVAPYLHSPSCSSRSSSFS